MKESELTEAENVCIFIYENLKDEYDIDSSICAAKQIGKKLLESLDPEIKPVFPSSGYRIMADGISDNRATLHSAEICNSFYSSKETQKEKMRLRAQRRVIEEINIANGGDNGFICGEDNFALEYNHLTKSILICNVWQHEIQSFFNWEYIRTQVGCKKLLEDQEFVDDWKLMKEIVK